MTTFCWGPGLSVDTAALDESDRMIHTDAGVALSTTVAAPVFFSPGVVGYPGLCHHMRGRALPGRLAKWQWEQLQGLRWWQLCASGSEFLFLNLLALLV